MNVTFKAFSYRRMETPYDKDGRRCHIAVVEARDIPKELEDWREVNPRDANLKSFVSRQIRETIDEKPGMFFFLNRGLVLMAKSVRFNNESSQVTVVFEDKEMHGMLDGGHTYSVIQESLAEVTEEAESSPLYVTILVVSGFDELEEIVDIVEARNTSRQVREDSLDNLRGYFDPIRETLGGLQYGNRIAYAEFELDSDSKPKPISVREILSYLICFDVEVFDEDIHPHRAYHSKHDVLHHYTANLDRMKKLMVLLPTILQLRDLIYQEMPEVYHAVGGADGGTGKFGKLSGIKTKDKPTVQLHFIGGWSRYVIPNSYLFPILAAFRTLVEQRSRSFGWAIDPIVAFHEHKQKLVKKIGHLAREAKSANKLGKDSNTWGTCYDALEKAMLRSKV